MATTRKHNGGVLRSTRAGTWQADVYTFYGRRRKTLRSEDQARAWIDQERLKERRREATAPDLDVADATRARDLLPPEVSLTDAARFYLKQTQGLRRVPVKEAVDQFLAAKTGAGRRPRTLETYRCLMQRLIEVVGADTPVRDTNPQTLIAWLDTNRVQGWTRDNHRAVWGAFFAWAQRARLIDSNPTECIEVITDDQSLPGFLTVDQAALLFARAEEVAPRLCARMALGAFAGLRTSELDRLDVAAIGDHIHIGPAVAKKRRQRYVTISANLRNWLDAYLPARGPVGVSGPTWREAFRKMTAQLFPWPRNGLRHSFATYHLALHKNPPLTAHELGHRATDLLYAHYRSLATEGEGIAYFNIVPAGSHRSKN